MRDNETLRGMLTRAKFAVTTSLALAVAACGGGGTNQSSQSVAAVSTTNVANCTGSCANSTTFLTVSDVQSVLARAISEAQARNVNATIAVTDRVGNVLAVFQMAGASTSVTVGTSAIGISVSGGLEGVNIVPSTLAAIAKAVTGAYLSSEGNAFSTRTASQIVQQHFNPNIMLTASGPLSGVQFSSLPCSDLVNRFTTGATTTGPGPYRSPLGLSADPGGFPLYKGGTVVGAVGVSADGVYALDPTVTDFDSDTDEAIALAATFGLAAPTTIRADQLTVNGVSLRFTDVTFDQLMSSTSSPPAFATVSATGTMPAVTGYYTGTTIIQGTVFGTAPSGIRPDALDYPGLDAFVLVSAANTERFRPRAGTETTNALTATEAQAIVASALGVANIARAQIRFPQNSQMRATISLVDSNGVILAIARTRDAPVFGTDVSLQKARTAAFLSTATAASSLTNLPPAVYLNGGLAVLRNQNIGPYVTTAQALFGIPTLFADGQVAFTARAVGSISRLFMPDGVDGNPNGPFAKPLGQWSVFSDGIQLDVAYNAIINHVGFVLGATTTDVPQNCTGNTGLSTFTSTNALTSIANGLQIFAGSVPVYRNTQLVGAVGVSGDGIDQDDMVAFLGVQNAISTLNGSINQAPMSMRADQLSVNGTALRYVSCPQAPFINSNQTGVCNGI